MYTTSGRWRKANCTNSRQGRLTIGFIPQPVAYRLPIHTPVRRNVLHSLQRWTTVRLDLTMELNLRLPSGKRTVGNTAGTNGNNVPQSIGTTPRKLLEPRRAIYWNHTAQFIGTTPRNLLEPHRAIYWNHTAQFIGTTRPQMTTSTPASAYEAEKEP